MLIWTDVGKGRLAVRGRPGRSFWQSLPDTKATHLLTLLSEREGAQGVGLQAQKVGLKWTWLAMPNGDIPEGVVLERIQLIVPEVLTALQEGDSVVVHCAAGIHRTGMIAYLLLRASGFTAEVAREKLMAIRQATGEGVGQKRLDWVDTVIDHF